MKRAELIFVPAPCMGHLVSTLEFAKRLIDRDARISVTILCMKLPFSSFFDVYTKSVTASYLNRIKLIDLPQAQPPPMDYSISPARYMVYLIDNYVSIVKHFVTNIVSLQSSSDSTSQVFGLVLDFLCANMVDIANELDLACYLFLTSNAGYLGLMRHLTIRHSQNNSEFKYSDPEQLIPGFINPVPPSVLPSPLFHKDRGYPKSLQIARRFEGVKGIIVNTFEELEAFSLGYFSHAQNPRVYAVGPVLDISVRPNSPDLDLTQRNNIMKWLDEQPHSSVVFLCFGSWGNFEAPQVKEIALGLERSGYRFLWSLRLPPPNNEAEEMLPEGFLERTRGGLGMICRWAPQVEVLGHKAIGGFVSHCGWNSILESLWFGVPIATWPLYAEQQLNAFRMVKELGLAVELRLDYREEAAELVMADEIENVVRQLMDGGSEVRNKVKEMATMARKAIAVGGSSFMSIGRLIEDIIAGN